jgi:DNA (cytosine-5)-methyltransferase 1
MLSSGVGMIVDLYGGPGGWAEGLRMLSLTEIGIELDPWACATRRAAGHPVIRADVARCPLQHLAGRVEGLIGSPPCPTFSAAGKGAGRAVLDDLAAAIVDALAGRPTLAAWRRIMARKLRHVALLTSKTTRVEASAQAWRDATQAALTVQPARWAAALKPRWVALEQVPDVLPLWRIYARQLGRLGYSTWAGILNAADYGVPQTRRRAILIASLDRPVGPPWPRHARGGAATLFGQLAPWVSMADALGWDEAWQVEQLRGAGILDRFGPRPPRSCAEPAPTVRANGGSNASPGFVLRTGANSMVTGRTADDVQPYERPVDQPAPTLDAKTGSSWRLVPGSQVHRVRPTKGRDLDQPAPTLAFGHDAATWRFELHTNRGQGPDGTRQKVSSSAPALTAKAGGQWAFDRPATTIAGDNRCWPPGHKVNADDRRRHTDADERYGDRAGTDAVRLTIDQALVLQSFRPDYPVQGTKTKQFEQVGNACPPLLSAHIVSAATGILMPSDAA